MTDQYVPKLRRRFLEDMRIKGLQPKTLCSAERKTNPAGRGNDYRCIAQWRACYRRHARSSREL